MLCCFYICKIILLFLILYYTNIILYFNCRYQYHNFIQLCLIWHACWILKNINMKIVYFITLQLFQHDMYNVTHFQTLQKINKTRRSRWCAGNHRGPMLKCKKKKKQLNFVVAILNFWRAFLNQFWPNFVHT